MIPGRSRQEQSKLRTLKFEEKDLKDFRELSTKHQLNRVETSAGLYKAARSCSPLEGRPEKPRSAQQGCTKGKQGKVGHVVKSSC